MQQNHVRAINKTKKSLPVPNVCGLQLRGELFVHLKIIKHVPVWIGHAADPIVKVLVFRVSVKLRRIAHATGDGRLVGCLEIPAQQAVPDHFLEPRMVLDVVGTALEVTQALGQVLDNELLQEIEDVGRKVVGICDGAVQDVFVGLHGRGVVEWGVARQHLEDEDAERPPVDRLVVGFGGDDFGRDIIGRTAQGVSDVGDFLCEAEIGQLDVAVLVQQDVFRLEVPVDDIQSVEVLDGEKHFGGVEFGHWRGKALGLAQEREELSALYVIHDHEQVVTVLESAPHSDDEGVLGEFEHTALVIGMFDLLHIDDALLLQRLHGIKPAVMNGTCQVDTSKQARAQRPQDLEVVEGIFALGGGVAVGVA